MHKLNRPVNEPQELALARATSGLDWDHFPTSQKDVVRDELLVMQNFYCAYCEREIHKEEITLEDGSKRERYNGHIEHFRRKNQYFHPELMFDWNNLFFSCMTGSTCGKHKDRYISDKTQYHLLIDPCKDNPEDFFVFAPNGTVGIHSDLNKKGREYDKERALFTINAFNLNEPNLIKLRRETIQGYSWLNSQSDEELDEILKSIRDQMPFVTSIYHSQQKKVNP